MLLLRANLAKADVDSWVCAHSFSLACSPSAWNGTVQRPLLSAIPQHWTSYPPELWAKWTSITCQLPISRIVIVSQNIKQLLSNLPLSYLQWHAAGTGSHLLTRIDSTHYFPAYTLYHHVTSLKMDIVKESIYNIKIDKLYNLGLFTIGTVKHLSAYHCL